MLDENASVEEIDAEIERLRKLKKGYNPSRAQTYYYIEYDAEDVINVAEILLSPNSHCRYPGLDDYVDEDGITWGRDRVHKTPKEAVLAELNESLRSLQEIHKNIATCEKLLSKYEQEVL